MNLNDIYIHPMDSSDEGDLIQSHLPQNIVQ